jgi:hypothetical protein
LKLIILGTADSMAQAPFDDKNWTVWACQPAITFPACKRVDRIFELHDRPVWQDKETVKRMNEAQVPVVMQRKYEEVPLSEALPLEGMIAHYQLKGMAGARYFTSTIAFMLSYALYVGGWEQIALFGVHMAADEEYGNQRQSMEYWVGVANGMGIVVVIPDRSSICSAKFLYGYDTESTMLTEIRKMGMEFQKGLSQAKSKVDASVQEMYQYEGAIRAMAKLRRIYS